MERGPALLCTEGLLAGQRFPITPEGLRIGREAGNEVHIDDAGVSRQHARVLLHNGAVWVQDAGSRNGIFVNGDRVPDHKQLKVGDRLSVGAHVFDIVPPQAAAPAPRPVAPAPEPKPAAAAKPAPRWKFWPFVVAVVLAGGFIACIGLVGALGDDEASAAAPGQPTYSLTTLLEPGAAPPPTAGGAAPVGAPAPTSGGAAPTVADALAVVAGAAPDVALAAIPDPPPGTTARQLLDTAQVNYDSGRLADARLQYQQALKLDPSCEICSVRAERIAAELDAKVQQHLDAGMRAYDAMQFTQAIGAWETVLMLVPDAKDPRHAQAAQYLQKAREASRGR